MRSGATDIKHDIRANRWLTAIVLCAWTLLIAASLSWNLYNGHQQNRELAANEARANFNKDMAFRLWATKHGGVYVPVDTRTPPNPNLSHIPERDIETPSGLKLTLMNPAYMLRQMMTEFGELYGVRGRITSFLYLNPVNAPDEWESSALRAFEEGADEVFEFTDYEGQPYLRLIRPMMVETGCLKCHGNQGYTVGDVRGGVGVSVPMGPYLAIQRKRNAVQLGSHGFIWVVGMAAIAIVAHRSRARMIERRQINVALEAKSRELEAANEELQQFAFAVAHDLQEPLRIVVTHTQVIERRHKEMLDKEANLSIGYAVEAAKAMRAKVVDIQAYLRAMKEVRPFLPVDTGALVANVLEELKGKIVDENAAVRVASLPTITADAEYLGRVFHHLIANAIEYHMPGRPPEVSVAAEEGRGEWIFSVRDNGIGIDPVYHDRIFGVFKRLHTQEEFQGTGMGLTISKKIVERHGGRLWLESEPGKGSIFSFTIPM